MTIAIENKNGLNIITNNQNEVYYAAFKTWLNRRDFFSPEDYEMASFANVNTAKDYAIKNNIGEFVAPKANNQTAIFAII